MTKDTVLIYRCEEYDVQKLEEIIVEGMKRLNFTPKGKTLIKANEVAGFYKRRFFQHSNTEPEVLDAFIRAIKSNDIDTSNMEELYLGGKAGVKMPTRYTLKVSGLLDVLKSHKVKAKPFDEFPEKEIMLLNGVVHQTLKIPTPLYNADTLICLPRLKANPFSTISATLKMNIGMLNDKERMIGHDYRLQEKIVDVLEVANYDFVAADAVVCGASNMLVPEPYRLGAIVMGTNSLAVDSVLSNGVSKNPREIEHLLIANKRGYGPIDLQDIRLGGNMSFQEFRERGAEFKTDMRHIDSVESNISFYSGGCHISNPNDYCYGGCPGAFKVGLEISEVIKPETHHKVKPMHIVFGHYRGDIVTEGREPIIFVGKDKTYKGKINGKYVELNTSESTKTLRRQSECNRLFVERKCPPTVIDVFFLMQRHGGMFNIGNPFTSVNNWPGALEYARDYLISKFMYGKNSLQEMISSD